MMFGMETQARRQGRLQAGLRARGGKGPLARELRQFSCFLEVAANLNILWPAIGSRQIGAASSLTEQNSGLITRSAQRIERNGDEDEGESRI
jgi:hypothetical protein